MNKNMLKILLGSLLAIMLISSAGHTVTAAETSNWKISTNLSILVVTGDSFDHQVPDISNFNQTYRDAGNTVDVVEMVDFDDGALTGYDALFFTDIDNHLSSANLTAIKNWYETGNKLLWVAGNSDFGGFFAAQNGTNPILDAVQSNLRIDAGAIEDPESNDGAAYRVVANNTGVSSFLTDNVTMGFTDTIFHGPSAITYSNGTHYFDMRSMDLSGTGIDIVVNSSEFAVPLDQDTSLTDQDVYAYASGEDGNYPMLATQQFNGSMVVASGEAIFSNYKNMYSYVYENMQTANDGMMLVDNLLSYWFTDFGLDKANQPAYERHRIIVTETETTETVSTTTETTKETVNKTVSSVVTQKLTETKSPINGLFVLGALALLPTLFYLKRKND